MTHEEVLKELGFKWNLSWSMKEKR
jgi:hypothetical protein